ncbi:uncharacterized protein MJAP1_000723 [Malassezia japonica]|uniref:C2H2-type domain-containing protein n=1 Tax=Malassezia japonica TaxID=223818 RepID=A0AAF0EVM4_9BASI|nr:uncharacterized protein MJAP1_000723 [Malassezia japonica]WFD37776.1 hypothetical protein MJAP1_000723 [Malassezia japonica]
MAKDDFAQPRVEVSEVHEEETRSPEDVKETKCLWRGCGTLFEDAETLYRHLCDEHVGRNSKNNLCLSCGWDNCNASYSKRDHITSHIRIHIPMKPFACSVCGKSFKRSQDLKKHGRTHIVPSQVDKSSDEGYSSYESAPGAYRTSPSTTPSLYPQMPGLLSPRVPEEIAATPSYRSPSSRDSASPASSSYSHDASPRSIAPMYSAGERANMRYSPVDPLYPPMPKPHLPAEDASFFRARNAAYEHDLPHRGYAPPPPPPRAEAGWNTGTKRPRRSVDEFWGDVRRKKVAPVYDTDMADRLNQILTPGCAQDPGLLDLFLGDSLSALGGNAALESTVPATAAADRTYGTHTQASYDYNYNRQTTLPPPRPSVPNLAEINAWLVQLGMNVARPAPPAPQQGSVAGASMDASMPSLDFSQSLNMFGLTHIPGVDTAVSNAEPMHYPAPHAGSYAGAGMQDAYRPSRTGDYAAYPQLARESGVQPSYRHVEALTRAPSDTRTAPITPVPRVVKEEAMDEDDTPPPASRSRLYPSLPDEEPASPMSSDHSRPVSPAGSASSAHWSDANVPRSMRERHLNLVLNVLLALNKRQRIDPQSGRLAPLAGNRDRSRSNSLHVPPYTPHWRSETRDRSMPHMPVLYDLGHNGTRRSSPYREAPVPSVALRAPRPSASVSKEAEKPAPRPGALPSIAQLLSDVDMN